MLLFINKNRNLFIYFFFISLFIIGIFIFSDYGLSVDDDNSRVNGFVSLKHIFEIFFSQYTFKIDDIIDVSNINIYEERYNGSAFDLPMAFLELVFKITDSRQIYLFRHFFNFLLFFTSVFIFYKIVKNRYNSYFTGIIGAAFLVASPRIFAESFYNTKDICLMSLFIINLFTAINFIEKPNIKTAIIFAIISSLTIDVRILGIFLPVLIFLIYIINILRNNDFKNKILPLLFFLITLPFLIILFWPYLWGDPVGNFIEAFAHLSKHTFYGYNFYLAEYISVQNVPWHYPIVWIFITTPIFYLVLFVIGFVFIVYRLIKRLIKIEENNSYKDLWRGKRELQDLIFFSTFLIPIFIIIILNSTLYDGWRHLYFIYPSFLMISIYGLNLIKIVILKKKDLLINFLTCFLVLQIFIWMYLNHPFQYVYFNLLAEKNFNKNFEMDYWGISNKIALEYIAKKTNKKVYVYNLNTSDLALSNKILKKKNRDLISVTYDLSEANYIINSFRDWNGATKPQDYLIPSNFEILYEIKVDGVTINSIYKKNKIF
jgi:hypothetical protein